MEKRKLKIYCSKNREERELKIEKLFHYVSHYVIYSKMKFSIITLGSCLYKQINKCIYIYIYIKISCKNLSKGISIHYSSWSFLSTFVSLTHALTMVHLILQDKIPCKALAKKFQPTR